MTEKRKPVPVYLDTPGTLWWLDALYAALGWQGGTIHEAIREVKRLKGCETYYDGQCADQDVLELLEETNATLSAARDDLQRQLIELARQQPVAWWCTLRTGQKLISMDTERVRAWRDIGYNVQSLYAAPKPDWLGKQVELVRKEQATKPEHKQVPSLRAPIQGPGDPGYRSCEPIQAATIFAEQAAEIRQEQSGLPEHKQVPPVDHASRTAPADTPGDLTAKYAAWESGEPAPAEPRFDTQRRCMTRCQSDDDGDCEWQGCPQLRDNEPEKTGRHCPLDADGDDGDEPPDTPAMVEARRLIAEGWEPVADHAVRNRIDSSRRMPVGRAVVGAMGTLMIGGGK